MSESIQFKESVRGIVEYVLKGGSLDDRFVSRRRVLEGTIAHGKLQRDNEKVYQDYEKEVILKHEFLVNNISLIVEGRADGIIKENGKIIIEEIKSTYKDLSYINFDYNLLHWAQGKFYGYIYCVDNNIDEIDIRLNSNRDFVREKYSTLEYKKKGNTRYVINSDNQYDILDIGKNYVTVFYDIHEDNKVCGYQIISKKAESTLNGIYPQGNDRLQESFEAQTKDLVNTERTKNNLNILSYSEKATTSSRKHSEDMMIKNYFDHTNKENKSPFDRMEEEGINYKNAGENIAAGQSSAIYAHHAWMNSLGHRKNILGDYKYIGVGVIFGGYYNIYYTQNFYT